MKNRAQKNVAELLMKILWPGFVVILFAASVCAGNSEFFHTGAKLQLSTPVADLLVVSLRNYDDFGNDKSIGFQGQKYELRVTLYIYPQKVPDNLHDFKFALDAIQKIHPDSQLVKSGTMTMMVGKVETPGRMGLVLFKDNSKNMGSFLFIFPQSSGYDLKVRATYHRKQGEEGEAIEYALKSVSTLLSKLEPMEKTVEYQSVPRLEGRVTDVANVLTVVEREGLTNMLVRYEQETSHQIAILTIPTLSEESIEAFSMRVANSWGLGQRGLNNGILVTLAMKERKVRIELGSGLAKFISDTTAQSIIDTSMIPAFRRGDYAGGLRLGLERLMQEGRQFVVTPADLQQARQE